MRYICPQCVLHAMPILSALSFRTHARAVCLLVLVLAVARCVRRLLGVGKCWVTGHAALPYCSTGDCLVLASAGLLGTPLCPTAVLGTAFSISDCIVSNEWMIQLLMMIWEGCGRKRLWPNFKAPSWHLPVRTERNHENHVRIAGLRAEILTRDLPSTKQEC
jgi:hypothetical protein